VSASRLVSSGSEEVCMTREADRTPIDRPGKKTERLLRTDHALIAAVFALIIIALLIVANIGMDVLTSMRAYVGGEGLWSKAQKDSVHYLLRYGKSHYEEDYRRYIQSIAVPLADHEARVELQKPNVDRAAVSKAFVAARNHSDDVPGMITLFRRYYFEPHISHAIRVWTEADVELQQLSRLGAAVRQEVSKPTPDQQQIDGLLAEVDAMNERFPRLEDDFSRSLGNAARYARSVVFDALVAGAVLALLLGWFVSYRLILKAREADERYRHLFATASDAVVIADYGTGIILDANPKLAELTGIPVAKLLGTNQSALFGREIPAVPGASSLQAGDLVIRHVSGSSIPVDVRDNLGRFGSRLVNYSIVRDVRERRRLEEQVQEAARMESVGRLAGGVAHDFNNLLTVIAGHTQALKRLTFGEARDKVDHVRYAAERAATLVRQLLAFSRKQPLQAQPIDLNRVVRNMEDMVRGVLNEEIELEMNLAADLHRVQADPHQLEQIILNLCANARDAMPSGGSIAIRTWNADGEFVGFQVSDTGQGMDEATQSRMFEPFFTTKPQGKGTGLGLAMVYGTVKQSGGHISVQSDLGRGTAISILLPYATKPVPTTSGTEAIESTQGSERVLLVEDDPGVRQVLAYGLEQEGYFVYTAGNGRDALALFDKRRDEISAVITDLIMPGMGGIALGQHLRDKGSTALMIYVTGYHQDLEKYPSEELPLCGGFLLKPFTPQALAQTVRKAIAVGDKDRAAAIVASTDSREFRKGS
jgi:two-component system cell cycle sensor histidine kinase/response regulator CckA